MWTLVGFVILRLTFITTTAICTNSSRSINIIKVRGHHTTRNRMRYILSPRDLCAAGQKVQVKKNTARVSEAGHTPSLTLNL